MHELFKAYQTHAIIESVSSTRSRVFKSVRSSNHINMNHDTAREKVKRHRPMYKRIRKWSACVSLANSSLEFAKPLFSIAWTRSCIYWNDKAVDKFVIRFNITPVKFDGCAVGVKTTDGISMKKPWTVKTNMQCLHSYRR